MLSAMPFYSACLTGRSDPKILACESENETEARTWLYHFYIDPAVAASALNCKQNTHKDTTDNYYRCGASGVARKLTQGTLIVNKQEFRV